MGFPLARGACQEQLIVTKHGQWKGERCLAEEPRLQGRTGERATCDRGIDWAERRGRNVRNQIPDAAAVQTDSKLSGACYPLPEVLLRCELLVEEEGHGEIIPVIDVTPRKILSHCEHGYVVVVGVCSHKLTSEPSHAHLLL